MFVVDCYYVPPEIACKIASGALVRYGNVVKYAAGAAGSKGGQVVTWLKKANPLKEGVNAIAKTVSGFVSTPQGLFITAIAAGGAIYKLVDYIDDKDNEKQLISKFNASLSMYLDSIGKGCLNEEILDNLLSATENLIAQNIQVSTKLSRAELESLWEVFAGYTKKMIDDNQQEDQMLPPERQDYDSNIVWLEDILKMQQSLSQAEPEESASCHEPYEEQMAN